MKTKNKKPEGMDEAHFKFLDHLRESGEVNMFGAGRFLQTEFGIEKAEARSFLTHWMETYEDRHGK